MTESITLNEGNQVMDTAALSYIRDPTRLVDGGIGMTVKADQFDAL